MKKSSFVLSLIAICISMIGVTPLVTYSFDSKVQVSEYIEIEYKRVIDTFLLSYLSVYNNSNEQDIKKVDETKNKVSLLLETSGNSLGNNNYYALKYLVYKLDIWLGNDTGSIDIHVDNIDMGLDGKKVATGDKVSVHYVGMLEDGRIFDTSYIDVAKSNNIYNSDRTYEVLSFVSGGGKMIPGFDYGIQGMQVVENKLITIQPENAYGKRNPENVQVFDRNELTTMGVIPIKGGTISISNVLGIVMEINDHTVTVDFNHFLAGKTLIFDVEVVSIEK